MKYALNYISFFKHQTSALVVYISKWKWITKPQIYKECINSKMAAAEPAEI